MDFLAVAFADLHHVVPSPGCEALSVLVAFACGAIVGFEREKGHKPAGLRTQILICVGSAIFTVVSMSPALGGREPARIAAQIVTGVGFLGAGSILRDRHQITGLTTAATIWTVSAIGIVAGAGYVMASLCLSLAVLLVLVAFRRAEAFLGGRCTSARVCIVYRPDRGRSRALIVAAVDGAQGPHAIEAESERADGLAEMRIRHCDLHREHRHFLAEVAAIPAVEALETWTPAKA
ncbi:MAG: MgtC/SapB family protein [Deltaproteobacteria bacterium]|nr:MgtC/SapB family protein [Deltaproteobacteria bacterium]